MRTHCRKVTAVCQPWLTMQFVIEEAKARHKIRFQIECEGIFQGIHYGSVTRVKIGRQPRCDEEQSVVDR